LDISRSSLSKIESGEQAVFDFQVLYDHCDPNDSVPERLTTEGGRF
jgi:hypothetical protein